jgi:hypothetical protein
MTYLVGFIAFPVLSAMIWALIRLSIDIAHLVSGNGDGVRYGYECPQCHGLSQTGGPFPWWVPRRLAYPIGRRLAKRRHWRAAEALPFLGHGDPA